MADSDLYEWAGPVRLQIDMTAEQREGFRLAHYRRGVRKYQNQLRRGETLPPVVQVQSIAGTWSLQDGNHRFEAIVREGRTEYKAFLARPKQLTTEPDCKQTPA